MMPSHFLVLLSYKLNRFVKYSSSLKQIISLVNIIPSAMCTCSFSHPLLPRPPDDTTKHLDWCSKKSGNPILN